mmetsp:Transcript_19789/g.32826  ORF Transcript_19789/g.32826 Transcript_19789/m.32826 type:complete len:116 (+) Transcript_19789:556-903(+)
MKLFQLLSFLLSAVAAVDAFYDYHNDPAKKEHLDNIRSLVPNLQTGSHLNGKNVLNKQRGADNRVYRADDMLTKIQTNKAGTAQHGINMLLASVRKQSNNRDESYDESDDEEDEF